MDELVKRTLAVARPLRIILFGSAARGDMGPDSDFDLLVVVPDGVHRRRTSRKIYQNLIGLGISKDIIVVTERDIHDYGGNPSLVIFPALKEGKDLYHAPE